MMTGVHYRVLLGPHVIANVRIVRIKLHISQQSKENNVPILNPKKLKLCKGMDP